MPHRVVPGLGWPEVKPLVRGALRQLGWPAHGNHNRDVSRETTPMSFSPSADDTFEVPPVEAAAHQPRVDAGAAEPGFGETSVAAPWSPGADADDPGVGADGLDDEEPPGDGGVEGAEVLEPAGGEAEVLEQAPPADDEAGHLVDLPMDDGGDRPADLSRALEAAVAAGVGEAAIDAADAARRDADGPGGVGGGTEHAVPTVTPAPPAPAEVSTQERSEATPHPTYDGPAAPRDYATTTISRAERRAPATLPKPAAPRIITVANQKGGVGKTTSAVNLAAGLAQAGLRVLVIDTDPQGNASTALGIDHRQGVPSIYEVLVEEVPLGQVIQECPDIVGLSCAPATIDLAGAEIELISFVARETRLQRAVAAFLAEAGGDAPDYVLIDCPPSLGLLTLNAFVAGREVLIPIQCEYYALEGLSMLLKNIEMIQRHLNPSLHLSAILLTMFDGRTRLSSQVADEVRDHFPELVFKTRVPRSVRISEAPSHGLTVMTYDPTSTGALSYAEAAAELACMGGAR